MPALARNQASSCSNPILDIFTKVNGVLTDVAVLEFAIFEDVTTPGTPIQVYPGSGRQAVNLALCPTGEKISTGRFVAEYTPPITELIGTHIIVWYFKLTLASPEQSFSEEFEVLPEVTGSTSTGYCTIQDLRDEGVTISQASDDRLQVLIARASRRIDLYTGRWFEPRAKTYLLDGKGGRSLMLGNPIISVSEIKLVSDDTTPDFEDVDLGDVKIYNRHISQELLNPDDRENPRIDLVEFDRRFENPSHGFHQDVWPEGTQNVEVTGVFGYTDPDGTPTGRTPEPIKEACMLLIIRFMLSGLANADDVDQKWRVRRYKTRDQEIEYQDANKLGSAGYGVFSGDPEIDRLVAAYVRPPEMGAA